MYRSNNTYFTVGRSFQSAVEIPSDEAMSGMSIEGGTAPAPAFFLVLRAVLRRLGQVPAFCVTSPTRLREFVLEVAIDAEETDAPFPGVGEMLVFTVAAMATARRISEADLQGGRVKPLRMKADL